jgi:hypothetical protein
MNCLKPLVPTITHNHSAFLLEAGGGAGSKWPGQKICWFFFRRTSMTISGAFRYAFECFNLTWIAKRIELQIKKFTLLTF